MLPLKKLSYCYCTIKSSQREKGWKKSKMRKPTDWAWWKHKWEKKMVQAPPNQKYVDRESEGQPEQNTRNSTLLPGGAQWASGHRSLVFCLQVRMRERKLASLSIEFPPTSSSIFQPMWMPKAEGIWWGHPMGAWDPNEERPPPRVKIWGKEGIGP